MLLCWLCVYLKLIYLLLGSIPWSLCNVLICLLSQSLLYNYFVWYKYCYPGFNFVSICLEYVFYPLIFSLWVSVDLKWVSCRQHMYESCFCTRFGVACLLIGSFSPFVFKVVVDRYVLFAILFIVFQLFSCFFFCFFFCSPPLWFDDYP